MNKQLTPKEKAKELVDEMLNQQSHTEEIYDAKQCALKAVDEMLNWFKAHSYSNKNYDAFVFYTEVKQEIEAL